MYRTVFGETHTAFRETVRELVRDEVAPAYPEWKTRARPDRRFWRRSGEVGIIGIGVPELYGRLAGSTFAHSVVVTEEIQREFLAIGGLLVRPEVCVPYFLVHTNEEQKRCRLPRLAPNPHHIRSEHAH